MSESQILIVDDEAAIRFALEETLTRDGYQVMTAADGETASQLAQEQAFDLALVDLRLPGMNGLELMAGLRQQTPDLVIIVLTAHASLETAVEALRQGAHDYLFKPCKTVELRESIKRGLRKRQQLNQQRLLLRQLEQHLSQSLADIRAATEPDAVTAAEVANPTTPPKSLTDQLALAPDPETDRFIQRGDFIVDFVRHVITLDNHLLELSPTEFNLLAYLISETPRVISPQELVREVQGYESEQWEASEMVRYHIYRLRQKIKTALAEADPASVSSIRTVRGVGYTVSL